MSHSLKRRAFLMVVTPGKQKEYIDLMNPINAEWKIVMKRHGVHNYSIFLEEDSNLLFGYLEYESEEGLILLGETEECKAWWKALSQCVASLPDNSPMITNFKEVFHLD